VEASHRLIECRQANASHAAAETEANHLLSLCEDSYQAALARGC